jgi:hypothetical protein
MYTRYWKGAINMAVKNKTTYRPVYIITGQCYMYDEGPFNAS